MTDLIDQPYSASQIVVPPTLPSILKKYAKAAIRTQPYDLLVWSAAYFKAMAAGEMPPVKIRLEYPPLEPNTLTLGYVKLFMVQIGKEGQITYEDLAQKWCDVCLPDDVLQNILKLGKFSDVVDWQKFIALSIGFIEESLKKTMIKLCEMFTDEPEGASSMISSELFINLYRYLAEMDYGPVEEVSLEQEAPCVESDEAEDVGDEEEEEEIPGPQEETAIPEWDAVIQQIDESSRISVATFTLEESLDNSCNWPDLAPQEDKNEVEQVMKLRPTDEIPSDIGIPVMDDRGIMADIPDKDLESLVDTKNEEEKIQDGEGVDDVDSVSTPEQTTVEPVEEATPIEVPCSDDIGGEEEEERQEDGPKEQELSTEPESDKEVKTLNVIMSKVPGKIADSDSVTDGSISDEIKNLEVRPFENVAKDNQDWSGIDIGAKHGVGDLRLTQNVKLREKQLLGPNQTELDIVSADQDNPRDDGKPDKFRNDVDVFRMHVPGIGPALPEEMIEEVVKYVKTTAAMQSGYIMPRNLRHFLCPPLDLEASKLAKCVQQVLKEEAVAAVKLKMDADGNEIEKETSKSDEVVIETEDITWMEIKSQADSEVIDGDYKAEGQVSQVSVGAKLQRKASLADLLFTVDSRAINIAMKSMIEKTASINPSAATAEESSHEINK